jgi:hypothetical protein
LFINTKTAKTRGLTISKSVLLRADLREGCAQALTERGPMKGMQARGCSSSPKFRLAAYQRSSGRLYVGGIKSVETSVQGVHAKMHDDDGHAPAGVVLRIYFQISISPLCENLPDAGK